MAGSLAALMVEAGGRLRLGDNGIIFPNDYEKIAFAEEFG